MLCQLDAPSQQCLDICTVRAGMQLSRLVSGQSHSTLLVCLQTGHFDKMRDLIEHAVKKNGGKQAVIVAHSMGCLVSLYFITRQSADWR